tara:strand:- start:5071 stop:5403 length:333 start_codon:yes stop_codon:yes gene_type:complete
MDGIKNTVCMVLNLPQGGGKLLTRDDYTLVLMDYDYLPHAAIQHIVDQHPHLTVETHQCDSSSSGYVVIFTNHVATSVFKTSVFMQICLTLVFVLVVYTLPRFDCWRLAL